MDLFMKGVVYSYIAYRKEVIPAKEYVITKVIENDVYNVNTFTNRIFTHKNDPSTNLNMLNGHHNRGHLKFITHPIPENRTKLIEMLNSDDINTRNLARAIIENYGKI